jgi:hypothetical protein
MPITITGSIRRPSTSLHANSRRHPLALAIGALLLAPFAASALELGEASIKSGLGQSMIVEIPYRLANEEQIVAACVGLAAQRGAGDVPTYASVTRISVTPTLIQIFDERPVVEPLIGLNVEVHCPRSPHVMRSYELLVDLPDRIPATLANGPAVVAARASSAPAAAPRAEMPSPRALRTTGDETLTATATTEPTAGASAAATERAATSARARGLQGGSLPQGQTYQVVRGDTLTGIAARIEGRPGTIAETAGAIFAANPSAFTRGNPDLIEQGRSIDIPSFAPATATRVVAAEVPAPAQATAVAASTATSAAPAPAASPLARDVEPPAGVPTPVAVTRTDVATAPAGGLSIALIAGSLGALAGILLSAAVVFLRRRSRPSDDDGAQIREPVRHRGVELPSRIDVVEGSLTDTARQMATVRGATRAAATGAVEALPPDLEDLALAIDAAASVDFDVGAAVASQEGAEATANPGPAGSVSSKAQADAATVRINADPATEATVQQRQPAPEPEPEPIDDEQHTLTVVELDILRQDYEAEHTLTQAGSPALQEALADLAATQAALPATAETATLESALVGDAADSTLAVPTVRLQRK